MAEKSAASFDSSRHTDQGDDSTIPLDESQCLTDRNKPLDQKMITHERLAEDTTLSSQRHEEWKTGIQQLESKTYDAEKYIEKWKTDIRKLAIMIHDQLDEIEGRLDDLFHAMMKSSIDQFEYHVDALTEQANALYRVHQQFKQIYAKLTEQLKKFDQTISKEFDIFDN